MPDPTAAVPSSPDLDRRRQLALFFGAAALIAGSMGIHESIFNNFLSDTFDLSADHRGGLEFPRETPGFLVVAMAGLLAALPVARLGVVGGGLMALGLFGMAFLGGSYWPMVAMMMLASCGMHLLLPVGASLAVGLSEPNNRGRRLGQVQALETVGAMIGTGFVWLAFDAEQPQYRLGFLCAGVAAGLAALVYSRLHVPHLHQPRSRMVMRRQYGLYYLLELLFGARKQIFITFGPWVLVRFYGQPPTKIAQLFMIASFIGIGFKPLAGILMDRLGERTVLVWDGLVLALVCIGYGYALPITGNMEAAQTLACTCFVLDNLLFSLGAGRTLYASRLCESPQELTSTLSMGVSINHVASMTIPFVAGLIWSAHDHELVFLCAAVLALVVAGVSGFVPGRQHRLRA